MLVNSKRNDQTRGSKHTRTGTECSVTIVFVDYTLHLHVTVVVIRYYRALTRAVSRNTSDLCIRNTLRGPQRCGVSSLQSQSTDGYECMLYPHHPMWFLVAATNGQPFLSPFNELVPRRSRFRELRCISPFAVHAFCNSAPIQQDI